MRRLLSFLLTCVVVVGSAAAAGRVLSEPGLNHAGHSADHPALRRAGRAEVRTVRSLPAAPAPAVLPRPVALAPAALSRCVFQPYYTVFSQTCAPLTWRSRGPPSACS